ncbi:MAG: hypothetical protein Q9213_002281 [Squamulea squamosa]
MNKSWRGTMGSHYLSIFTAWTLATVPMVILAVAFSLVVENSKPEAPPGSYYSDREHANLSLGSAIYSKIPSTQLTFVASFSSTLATTVLPAVMALVSYPVALAVSIDSDKEIQRRLPSPYQLELLISALNGSLLALWSFTVYMFSNKRRRVASVSTVQYVATVVVPPSDSTFETFAPGRGLWEGYLDLPSYFESVNDTRTDNPDGVDTVIAPVIGPINDKPERQSSYQGVNSSEETRYLSIRDGWLIVPAETPAHIDFEATTFGNLTDLRDSTFYASDQHGFTFMYYTDANKTTISMERSLRGPTFWYAALLQVQLEFVTNQTLVDYAGTMGEAYEPKGNYTVVQSTSSPLAAWGINPKSANAILSCTTTLSDVQYALTNGSVVIKTRRMMNRTASSAFIYSFRQSSDARLAHLQQGVQNTLIHANSPEDIASGWASTVDQAILSFGEFELISRPPLSITRSTTTQVTRIPRAPFVTLIVLDLLYATIGTCLMFSALIAVCKGRGVRDAQARLSTLAVVAESFENPAYGDDANDVDMLFAERRGRGESTRRIALVRRAGGGRRFKQLVDTKNYVKGSSSTTSGSFMQGSSVGSSSS